MFLHCEFVRHDVLGDDISKCFDIDGSDDILLKRSQWCSFSVECFAMLWGAGGLFARECCPMAF